MHLGVLVLVGVAIAPRLVSAVEEPTGTACLSVDEDVQRDVAVAGNGTARSGGFVSAIAQGDAYCSLEACTSLSGTGQAECRSWEQCNAASGAGDTECKTRLPSGRCLALAGLGDAECWTNHDRDDCAAVSVGGKRLV